MAMRIKRDLCLYNRKYCLETLTWLMEEQSIGQIFLKIDLLKNQPTIIISKQKNDGRGIMERTFNGRFQVNMGRKGQPSKWITIKCLRILKGLNPNRGGV